MHEIEKKDVLLAGNGPLPVVHLQIASLVEATYRLVLRRPAAHPQGLRGETFVEGDFGDDPAKFPDDHPVNFIDKSLQIGGDLNTYTLSALISYAAPSDSPKQSVALSVVLTQDEKEVPNGRAEHREQFTDVGGVIIRFRLKA